MTVIDKLNSYLLRHPSRPRYSAPPIKCRDGFTVSVQASAHHYCAPRQGEGPWTHVECGFPSAEVPEWREWREGDVDTDTVFGYVPIELVALVIEQHGGSEVLDSDVIVPRPERDPMAEVMDHLIRNMFCLINGGGTQDYEDFMNNMEPLPHVPRPRHASYVSP